MQIRYRNTIEDLYMEMYDMLFAYACRLLANDCLAEEAVQDAFIIACQKPEALYASSNPKGWIVNTLKNVISNMVRKQCIARRIITDYLTSNINSIDISDDFLSVEIQYGNIAHTDDFQLLKQIALEGASCQELAKQRGITPIACRKRIQRAREQLQRKIQL